MTHCIFRSLGAKTEFRFRLYWPKRRFVFTASLILKHTDTDPHKVPIKCPFFPNVKYCRFILHVASKGFPYFLRTNFCIKKNVSFIHTELLPPPLWLNAVGNLSYAGGAPIAKMVWSSEYFYRSSACLAVGK